MKAPSASDRFVKVGAYLSDEESPFGMDAWCARQYGAPDDRRYGVFIVCESEDEQREAFEYLRQRAIEKGERA